MPQVVCPSCQRKHSTSGRRAGRLPSCRRCGITCVPDSSAAELALAARQRNPHWLTAIIGVITAVVVTVFVFFLIFLMFAAPRRR